MRTIAYISKKAVEEYGYSEEEAIKYAKSKINFYYIIDAELQHQANF
jgi:hypothetical protein